MFHSESRIKAPKQFVDDFEFVAAHYRLAELGEYDEAKLTAKNNIADAQICFSVLAKDIRCAS